MANSRQSATIFSPSSKRPTKRTRSSITEHSFQGIASSPRGGSVTYVSGTNCHPCVRPLMPIHSHECENRSSEHFYCVGTNNIWGSRSLTPSSYDESVWQQEAGPTVFTPFADTKPREQKCSRPIILLWTIAETRTCGDIPWELRPSLA